jgi:DNA-binding transcriptional LysR family regulator
VDLDGVRTFVAAADTARFQDAADDLAVTQQAVSKRIAALERDLGVRLFTRTARGARLTADGRAFLPHARDLLRAADRAVAAVRPDRRPLRVDVLRGRLAPAELLRGFHRAHPATALDVRATLRDAGPALAALAAGEIDASFRAVGAPGGRLPAGLAAARVLDEPLHLVTGPGHALAGAPAVAPADLAGHRIWMPGLVPGAEWTAYYADLAAAFGLDLDDRGPHFGTEALLDAVAGSPRVATLVGARTRLHWPPGHDLRRVPVHGPTPVYPHSLVWRADDPHPGLRALRRHLAHARTDHPADAWAPAWAAR